METTADILAVGEVVGTKVDSRRVGDGLRADMASSMIAPVFNSFPATAFAQNVGLVALSGIKSRFAVAAGGVLLVVLGLSPMAAAVCVCSFRGKNWRRASVQRVRQSQPCSTT